MRYIALILLALITSSVYANEESYVAELDRLAAKRDLNDLVERVNQPRNIEEARQGLTWLRAKSLSGFGGVRIFYSYAYGLFRANVKDTATFSYLIGTLVGRVDAARCGDPTAPTDKLMRWEQGLTPISKNFISLSQSERKQLINMAVTAEERLKDRPVDSWLCNGGLSFMRKYAEKHKNDPNPPAREIQDETRIGRTILLDDPDIKPEFIADEEWKAKRKQIIVRFLEQMPLN